MNTRHIVTTEWWFGGGGDLNPTQAQGSQRRRAGCAWRFTRRFRRACDKHGDDLYPRYKKWADEYFWLPHRSEPRGVGGIFYDHHNSGGASGDTWEDDFAFTQDVGRAFLARIRRSCARRMHQAWTEADREEQLVQRGRYVEFNLLYDRGTTFGLKTGGNVESILSSHAAGGEVALRSKCELLPFSR